jgi:Fur family peroxide stress response transcriptional regulator
MHASREEEHPMAEPETRIQEMVACLRQEGYRLTPQRMSVLKILATSDQHPSVEQIYEQVQVDFPMTSLATVYKTVSLLKDVGQVLELGYSDDSNRYDGKHPSPHPHLVCVCCKKIVDSDAGVPDALAWQVAEKSGYQMVEHRLDFMGICPQCQNAMGRPKH